MKRALVILDEDLQGHGLQPGVHYEFVLNIHDEWQIEAFDHLFKGEHIPAYIAKRAVWAIEQAGRWYHLRCPLRGTSKVGRNWAQTH